MPLLSGSSQRHRARNHKRQKCVEGVSRLASCTIFLSSGSALLFTALLLQIFSETGFSCLMDARIGGVVQQVKPRANFLFIVPRLLHVRDGFQSILGKTREGLRVIFYYSIFLISFNNWPLLRNYHLYGSGSRSAPEAVRGEGFTSMTYEEFRIEEWCFNSGLGLWRGPRIWLRMFQQSLMQ